MACFAPASPPASTPRRAASILGALCAAAFAACTTLAAAGAAKAQVRVEAKGSPKAEKAEKADAAAPGPAAPPRADSELDPATHALLQEINQQRAGGAACGTARKEPAPPLRWHPALQRAAEAHARDMAGQSGGIGHAGSNGSTVGTRAEAAGYRWRTVGENVAAGRATASATLTQWMASPGHCSNIMNPAFTDVAVAGVHAPGTLYRHYWVMVLGRP